MEEIGKWLAANGLAHHAERIASAGLDLPALRSLDEGALAALGLDAPARRALRAALSRTPRPLGAGAAPDAPLAEPVSERRLLTVLFCDLVGSTALAGRLDPEDLGELLSGYRDRVAQEVERFGGFVANVVGDGVVACFGYPRAHEGDADRAIRAALAIVEAVGAPAGEADADLAVRIGIATGPVLVGAMAGERFAESAALIGEAPNLAARLQGLAVPGAIVVGARTRALAGEQFAYEDLGPREIKGFDAPVGCWRVTGLRPVESRFEARPGARHQRLVGRTAELAVLRAAWREARGGRARLVAVTGEPGIGKSRLIADAWATIAAPWGERVVLQCSQLHANTALHPVMAWLAHAAGMGTEDDAAARRARLATFAASLPACAPDTAALLARLLSIPAGAPGPAAGPAPDPVRELPPSEFRARILACIVEVLRGIAARKPLFLAVEDLHWADATTLDLIARMIEGFADAPVLLVVTYRPMMIAALKGRSDFRFLPLDGLDAGEAGDLVRSLLPDRDLPQPLLDRVVALAGGNPLFIEAAVQMAGEGGADLPATLHEMLQARLDRLGPGRRVAQFAAVLGRRFPREQLPALWPFGASALAEGLRALEADGLLTGEFGEAGAGYGFSHALIREAAYDSLLRRDRRSFHAHVAARLEVDFPGLAEREPHLLALHHAAAGAAAAAVPWLVRAAGIALARSAYVEAANHLEEALRLLEGVADAEHRARLERDVRLPYGAALVATRGYATPAVEENYRRIEALGRTVGDDGALVHALLGLSRAAIVRAEIARALELTGEMLAVVERLDAPELVLTAELLHGISLFMAGRPGDADRHLARAIEAGNPGRDRALANRLGQDPAITALVWSAHAAWIGGHYARAEGDRRRAIEAARELGHPFTLAYVLVRLAALDRLRGEGGSARALAVEAEELARAHAFPAFLASARFWLADGAAAEGDVGALDAMAEEIAAHAPTDQRNMVSWLWMCVADRALALGLPSRADEALERSAAEIAGTGVRWCEADMHRLRGRLAIAAGDPGAARDALDAAIAVARRQGARALELRAAIDLADLLVEDGDEAGAHAVLAAACPPSSAEAGSPDVRALLGRLRVAAMAPAGRRGTSEGTP